jgi:hypothetical protein
VLAGVLLHVIEAAGPIDNTEDLFGGTERRFKNVSDAILFIHHFDDADSGERAEIEGLASGSWIESGAVEIDAQAAGIQ